MRHGKGGGKRSNPRDGNGPERRPSKGATTGRSRSSKKGAGKGGGRKGSMLSFEVGLHESGTRLGTFLCDHLGPETSQRAVKRELERGRCSIDGVRETFSSRKLVTGETVTFSIATVESAAHRLEIKESRILFEDDTLLAYDKPAGYPCQPTRAKNRRNLHDELLAHLEKRGRSAYLGQVHRLDRDTTGVFLLVKDRTVVESVAAAFRRREVRKTYLALVHGCPEQSAGRWQSHLIKSRITPLVERWRTNPEGTGNLAITDYEVLQVYGDRAALLRLMPQTGRTHQLRVQTSEAGHPIVGDVLYSDRSRPLPDGVMAPSRHLLHAAELMLVHPTTGKRLVIRAPLPPDFADVIRALGGAWTDKSH